MLQLFLGEWGRGIEGDTRASVLRHVLVGGEVLPYALQKRFWFQYPQAGREMTLTPTAS